MTGIGGMCEAHRGVGLTRRRALFAGALLLGSGCLRRGTVPAREVLPSDTGKADRRYLVKGGVVMSMSPAVGDFARADVLVEGRRIVEVGPDVKAPDAAVIDAADCIVMPGVIDTHHHQFETALRGALAEGLVTDDGRAPGERNYFEEIIGKLAPAYRSEDVYASVLLGALSQLDAGVTTVVDTSQVIHTPEHSDALVQALKDAGRRAVFAFGTGKKGNRVPEGPAPAEATALRVR
ncbi:hypothetical protein D7X99_22970 [Corallococcus sp. AB032C]|uniref:amidohydrolase family protein n=2 Tax=Corallococcus TaxID=83461 RepID=UPI000ECDEB90|nr:amidohydrolase family protein [Corallococcus exiguus]RKH80107.1 hypothetical protein D7X99_22970 [Corallococcus sp. AB032C]